MTRVLGERQMFVAVNVAVNLIFLVRTYVTMQVLDYRGLGLAALLQTVVLLLGTLQLGFLNGGYRLICAADATEARRINNLVYSFLGALTLVALAIATIILVAGFRGGEADLVTLLGIGGGVLTLVRTWVTNRMVAAHSLHRLNAVNFVSALLSIGALMFIGVDPLAACLAAIVAQPALFVIIAVLVDRTQLPDGIEFDPRLFRAVMRAGFVLFLTGIFLQVNTMIERWYVTAALGVDALGHLYLAILFVTLFQLVPNSLDQLYLPALVRTNNDGDATGVAHVMRRFFLVIVAYCLLVAAVLALIARPATELVLPKYLPDLRYVFLIAPGLIAFTLAGPLAVMFNTVIRYRYYFIAYGLGSALTALVFAGATVSGSVLALDTVIALRSAVYAAIGLVIALGYLRLTRDYPQFRFALLRQPGYAA